MGPKPNLSLGNGRNILPQATPQVIGPAALLSRWLELLRSDLQLSVSMSAWSGHWLLVTNTCVASGPTCVASCCLKLSEGSKFGALSILNSTDQSQRLNNCTIKIQCVYIYIYALYDITIYRNLCIYNMWGWVQSWSTTTTMYLDLPVGQPRSPGAMTHSNIRKT